MKNKTTPIDNMTALTERLIAAVAALPLADKVTALNTIRSALHDVSPFASEPVDCVLWVAADVVRANGYNPNTVAPAEMKLLTRSIAADGYTQPIVSFATEEGDEVVDEVVDGFHRSRVGKEDSAVRERVHGYLPVARIQSDRTARKDRVAATVRHNRARGKHGVKPMSDIVTDLRREGWLDDEIGTELGMEYDEVLRLKQITGLAELFADREYSRAWEPK